MQIRDFNSAVAFLESVKAPFSSPNAEKGVVVVDKECARCGGSGSYSFNPTDGDKCFDCAAKKDVFGMPAPSPSRWKAKVDAVKHAREVKAKLAKAAREQKRYAAELAAREAVIAKQKVALANLPAILADLVAQLLPHADDKGYFADFRSMASVVRRRAEVEGLPQHLEVFDDQGNVERHESVVGRVVGMVRQEKRQAAGAGRAYVGAVDGKLSMKLRFESEHQFSRRAFHGGSESAYVVRFVDEAGNVLVWFAPRPFGEWKEDHYAKPVGFFDAAFVVKKHDFDHDGLKQTVINRVKVKA